ncbi:MAG TPA: chromosomal replication initiator protein DnaA [Patescibacteria group bacterium]|nr:chromosomal replication initiator protein DnaA [Patescibacteria group bacterium]
MEDTFETKKIWNEVTESIKVSVSNAIFSTWFAQTHLVAVKKTDGRIMAEIGCTSSFVKNTIENRYFGLLQDTLSKSLNLPCDLTFSVHQNLEPQSKIVSPTPLFEEGALNQDEINIAISQARLRFSFTFTNFAVSSSNQMAFAAADAVSKSPGSAYNPLFVWGGVGVGKTHLMTAVGHELLKKNPSSKVYFCTGEEFTNDIVEGIRNKTTQNFRDKYRRLHLLLIDDIQFIAGKEAVQEEFFHTFNALVGSGGQVILTSDQPPSNISRLEERLRSRFEAGLIVDISQPDFELRCAITQIKSRQRGLELEPGIVHTIAGNLDTPRKIEGFIIKMLSEINLKKASISVEMVESLIGKGEGENIKMYKAGPTDFINAVSKYYSVGKKELLSETRTRKIAVPRQILMYLMRTSLQLPLTEVGKLIGDRDHTTVMHAVDKITTLASTNVDIRNDIVGIKNLL